MKVFISQPMKDKTNDEILYERNKIIRYLHDNIQDVEILDSFFQDNVENVTPLWYLSRSLSIMSQADLIVFAKNWKRYRGCRIEYECAKEYGYVCQFLSNY